MPGHSDKWWHKPGIPVFPVKVAPYQDAEGRLRHTKDRLTPHWDKDAKDFDQWDWAALLKQGCNAVGIVMGERSGLYAIDLDRYATTDGGAAAEAWLDHWLPEWHETRKHLTPSGGEHIIFRINGAGKVPNRGNIGKIPGLQARGDGGYIAVGAGYVVVQDVEPRDLPHAAAEELRRTASSGTKTKTDTGSRKLSKEGFSDLGDMLWRDELLDAHPKLKAALEQKWGDRSDGLVICAGETLRAQVDDVDLFSRLLWASTGNARDHAKEKGWSRPILRAWDEARGSGKADFDPLPEKDDPLPGDGTGKKPLPPLVPRTFADIVRNYKPVDYLIEDIIPSGAVTMLVAQPSWGKTTILMEMARCIATGVQFGSHDVDRPGKFLYLVGEDDDGWQKRAIALWERWGLNPDLVVVETLTRQDVLDFAEGNRLDMLLSSGSYVGVGVDTLASWYDGDNESDNAQAQAFMRRLESWAMASGVGIVVSAHPTKDAKTGLARGASAFTGAAHTNLVLKGFERVSGVPGIAGVVKLHWDLKIRGDDFRPICFKLEKVVLQTYQTPKGKPIKSVVAVPITEAEYQKLAQTAVTASGLSAEEIAVLRAAQADPDASVRDRGAACNMPRSTLQRWERKLMDKGFLGGDRRPTEKGQEDISDRHGFNPLEDPE